MKDLFSKPDLSLVDTVSSDFTRFSATGARAFAIRASACVPASLLTTGLIRALTRSGTLLGSNSVERCPALLYVVTATMRTYDLALFVFGYREKLGELFLAGLAKEIIVGHKNLLRGRLQDSRLGRLALQPRPLR